VLARQAVAAELARRGAPEVGRRQLAGARTTVQPYRAPKGVVEVRVALPAADAARISAAAQREQMSRSEYLAVVIGGALEVASPTSAEVAGPFGWKNADPTIVSDLASVRDALVASTYQIGALGRNVNQIARSLNTTPGVLSARDRANLARVVPLIEAHLSAAGAVLLALRPVVAVRKWWGRRNAIPH